MSIVSNYIFDNENEIVYDPSLVEVVTKIDDPSFVNPFISGTTTFSGVINGSGYITPSSFYEVVSGQPWQSSGEIITFDFGTLRTLHSITIGQQPDRYAVDYTISGDNQLIVQVNGSTNSGDIFHKFAAPVSTQTVTVGVTQISIQPSNSGIPTYYEFTGVSGEANLTFTETNIVSLDLTQLTATSVVEPVENIFDNDPSTFWQSNNSYPQNVIWQFKNFENIVSFHYIAEDNTTYPTQFVLYSSLDGITYNSVLTRDSTNPVTSGELLATFASPVTTKYLKWTINAGVGAKVRIRDVFLTRRSYPQLDVNLIRMKKTVSNSLINPVSLSATSQSGTAVISNIVSTDTTKFWNSNGSFTFDPSTGTYIGSEMIQVDLGTPKTLDSTVLMNIDGQGVPVDFQLTGSNDNTTYTTIESITGNQLQMVSLNYDSVNTYRFYRFVFTNSTHPFVRIHHAELNTRLYPAQASVVIPDLLADSVSMFSVSSGVAFPATDIKYQINVDERKYWHDGLQWTISDGTLLNSNTLATVNAKMSVLPFTENFKIALIPVFQSDTTDTPILNSVTVTVTNNKNSDFIPKNLIRIRGFLTGFPGSIHKPIQLQVNLIRSVISIDGQTFGANVQTFLSDGSGYFDFSLPQTLRDGVIPKGAKFAVHIPILNYRNELATPALTEISLSDWLAGNFPQ